MCFIFLLMQTSVPQQNDEMKEWAIQSKIDRQIERVRERKGEKNVPYLANEIFKVSI